VWGTGRGTRSFLLQRRISKPQPFRIHSTPLHTQPFTAATTNSTNMLKNAQEVAAAARKAGCIVIHCPITFTDDYRELRADAYGILAK